MDIRHKATTQQTPRVNVLSRLAKIVRKRMTVDEIETEYVSRFGKVSRKYMLFELAELLQGGVLKRVKQGVYEP